MPRYLVPMVLAAVLAATPAGTAANATAAGPAAGQPVQLRGLGEPGVIPGRYLVVLKTAAAGGSDSLAALDAAVRRAEGDGGDVRRTFRHTIHGYTADLDAAALAEVRRDPAVAFVDTERRVSVTGTRQAASWGQDRLDDRTGLDGTLSTTGDGAGVTAYILDTGIRAGHTDFGGRVIAGYTAIQDGLGTDDCNGHGTHVAGTVGGAAHGVAPAVALVAVRVLGCDGSGTSSGVIAGIDWVTANRSGPAVANLSLGGGVNAALDHAVARSIAAGVSYVVAAGNEAADACASSPARMPAVLTVAASTISDASAGYTNHGSCVDLYAPGSGIRSAVHTSDTATAAYSGTSMAAPHVAGAAALHLQAHPSASPGDVAAALLADATPGAITGAPAGTPPRLLHLPAAVPAPAPTPTPSPTAPPTAPPSPTPTPSPTAPPSATPTPSPGVPTTRPCTSTGTRGNLAAKRSVVTPPYRSTRPGRHTGCLTGPPRANLNLYLDRWTGRDWRAVAAGVGPGATESVSYSGSPGRYRWRVVLVRGSGSFTLRVGHPG